jgi:hypothetical protein
MVFVPLEHAFVTRGGQLLKTATASNVATSIFFPHQYRNVDPGVHSMVAMEVLTLTRLAGVAL